MICNFNNFQLLKENRNTQFNIGDYVIVKHNLSGIYSKNKTIPLWDNIYGVITDIGRFNFEASNVNNLSLVKMLCELTTEQEIFLNGNHINDEDIVSTYHNGKKANDSWFNNEYLLKFDTKDEFDKEVEKIELEKAANKYNL